MDDLVKRLRDDLKRIFDDAGGSDTLTDLLADMNLEGSAELAEYFTSTEGIERLHTENERLRAELARVRWQPIKTAPHNKSVLLGWQDWRDGQWCMTVDAAATGERFDSGYSNLSLHGSATHWMPLPPPPQEPQT